MSDFNSFRLYDQNTGLPKDDATPSILKFVDRTGVDRTPPIEGIVNLGGGLYRIQASDADISVGTAFLVAGGAGVIPSFVAGTFYQKTSPFHALHFEDSSGSLMSGGDPTVSYRSLVDGTVLTPPTLTSLPAPYFYGIAPSDAELAAGVAYVVEGAIGSVNNYDGSFFLNEPVSADIYVTDESPVPIQMPGVEVAVYDPVTNLLVAEGMTDESGHVAFILPGSSTPGTQYEVRAYKSGVNFHGAHSILVTNPVLPGAPNKFDLTGADSTILPLSGSSLLCRCTGMFVNFSGIPLANKTIRIMAQGENLSKVVKVWDIPSKMVAPDVMDIQTDANGFASVNLVRTGQFNITFGGDDDTIWCIRVPERDAANFVDLIHPFPQLLDWDDVEAPGDAVSLTVNQTKIIPLAVTFTDYSIQSTLLDTWIDFINNFDASKVSAVYDSALGAVVLTGVAAGVATLTPQLMTGLQPARWPVPSVILPPLTITVT
jgi:hypothetical protein